MNKHRNSGLLVLSLTGLLLIVSCDLVSSLAQRNEPVADLPPPSETIAVRPTPPPTVTRDPTMVTATANGILKIYAAPALTAQVVGQLSKGDKVRIAGKSLANDWWQIVFLTAPNQRGWIAAQAVIVGGPVETLPVVKP